MKNSTLNYLLLSLFTLLLVSCSDSNSPAKEDTAAPSNKLTVDVKSLQFNGDGEEKKISITATGEWNAALSSGLDWCSLSVTKGSGDGVLTVKAKKSDFISKRSGSLIVSLPSGTYVNVSIEQEGENFDPKSYRVEPSSVGMRELSATQFMAQLKLGINYGNTYEAIRVAADGTLSGDETTWGNKEATLEYFKAIKAAGFDFVRIPVAWTHQLENNNTFVVRSSWLDKVQRAVDYALQADLYVVINTHWSGGWLDHLNSTDNPRITKEFVKVWTQIAVRFRDYDDRLLFAGANEVIDEASHDYVNKPASDKFKLQNGYNQTFVNTIRATGGCNSYRQLVVQAFCTNIEYALSDFVVPTDEIASRLMLEVHFYDPYDFTIMDANDPTRKSEWGTPFKNSGGDVSDWGLEDHMDSQMKSLRDKFSSQGLPVMIGEWAASALFSIPNDNDGKKLERHRDSRNYFYWYMTKACLEMGHLPVIWDVGCFDDVLGMFERASGEVKDPDCLAAMQLALQGGTYVPITL